MKGITPVVAIILLLLITISMVGFAFVWFTRVGELTTQQTQQQLQSQLDAQAQNVKIDAISAARDKITLRNRGTATIPLAQISIFVEGAALACTTWSPTAALTPGSIVTCTAGFLCAAGNTVKVTTLGQGDTVKCP